MQDSGITEIISLICTSAIWGQYPMFSLPEFPQGSLAHLGELQLLMTMKALFTDMAGNIPFMNGHKVTWKKRQEPDLSSGGYCEEGQRLWGEDLVSYLFYDKLLFRFHIGCLHGTKGYFQIPR